MAQSDGSPISPERGEDGPKLDVLADAMHVVLEDYERNLGPFTDYDRPERGVPELVDDIPVDTQVEQVTLALAPWLDRPGMEARRNGIRALWWKLRREYGVPIYQLSDLLWLIGANWDDWGRSYLESVFEESTGRESVTLPEPEHPGEP